MSNWWDNPLSALGDILGMTGASAPVTDASSLLDNYPSIDPTSMAGNTSENLFNYLAGPPVDNSRPLDFMMPNVTGGLYPIRYPESPMLGESVNNLPTIPSTMEKAAAGLNYIPSPDSSGDGLFSGLGQKVEDAGSWMDKNKTITSLGVSGLAFLSSLPAAKRAAAMQKMLFDQQQAALAAATTQQAKNNTPFTGTIRPRTFLGLNGQGSTQYGRSGSPLRNSSLYSGNSMNFDPKV